MGEADSDLVIERRGDVYVIEFLADSMVDQVRIHGVGQQLEVLAEKAGYPKIVISMSNLETVSSAVLGVLVSVNKKVQGLQGELRLASIPPAVLDVIKLTRLDKLLKIYANTSAALAKF